MTSIVTTDSVKNHLEVIMTKIVLVTGKWSHHIRKFPNKFSYEKFQTISGICCYSKEKNLIFINSLLDSDHAR